MGIFDGIQNLLGYGGAVDPNTPTQTFDDRVMNPMTQAGLALLANNGTRKSDRGAFEGVGEALTGAAKYQKAVAKQNKTLAYLREHHPEIASQVDGGLDVGDAFKMAMQEKQFEREMLLKQSALNQPTDKMREYAYAKQSGFDGSFVDYLTSNGTNGRLSTSPVYGLDGDGNTVIGQLSNDGRFVPSKLPDGVRPLSPEELNAQKAKGTALGKDNAAGAASLETSRATAQQVAAQVDALKNDPALENVLGPIDSRTPIFRESSARAQAKIDQLQGGAFLQARQVLKGGGQITDYEGRKAEQAYIRMNQAQSPEDFKAALDEFNDAVQSGVARLEAAYGSGRAAAPGAGGLPREAPTTGTSAGFSWSVK